MVRRTGIRIKFDKSLLFAAAVAFIIGPRWIMNQFLVSWPLSAIITAVATATILLGVLIHEAGHAAAARFSGVAVEGITVSWWGGATTLGPSTFGSSLLIAVCGPIVNGVFAAVMFFLSQAIDTPNAFSMGLYLGAWINAFLTVFNLLPFSPLDGSHALSDLVALLTKSREKGERTVAWIGISIIPLIFAWFIVQGRIRHWVDILVLLLVVGMIWKFSFDKLKQVDASAKSAFIAKLMCNSVEFAEVGTPSRLVSGEKDVVVLHNGDPRGFVPAELANTCKLSSPELTVEQLSSPVATDMIPASITALDLNEYSQGHFLLKAQRELGLEQDPTWLVEEEGKIIGLIHHREHLAHITG